MTAESRKALLIIDMLNDFVSDKGTLLVAEAKKILPNIKRELNNAGSKGIPTIYICDSHDERDSEFDCWPKHSVANTWGSQVFSELAPRETDYVVSKRRYSSFFATDLDLLLREMLVDTLIITGVVTNICVFFTAVDAHMRGYKIIIPQDCVAGLNREDHNHALEQLRQLCNARLT